MKQTFYLSILFLLLSTAVVAQEDESSKERDRRTNNYEMQTLFGSVNSHGGYGAIMLTYSQIDNLDALQIGGKGAWVVGHNMSFGIGGYGFFTDYKFDSELNRNINYQGGYGGFYFEPIILPQFPAHISIPLFVGVGGIAYVSDLDFDNNQWEDAVEDNTAFVVLEPGIEIEFNLFKYLRLATGITYRYTSDINIENSDKDILNGFTYGITLKMGKF